MNITFRELTEKESEFIQLQKWCQQDFIYEWFEQRILTLEEIRNKYQKKLHDQKQKIWIIQKDKKDIGLIQVYPYEKEVNIEELNQYHTIYEYDLFIGEEKYLSKGIGKEIISQMNDKIYSEYKADAIVLRPFKRNTRAIHCYEKCGFKKIAEYESMNTLNEKEEIIVLLHTKNKKYYEAYDNRYKQVHEKGLSWATMSPTPMVLDTIHKYHLEKENILEIGCGEGRDAKYLLDQNYQVLATDISTEAISFCQKNDPIHKDYYQVLDVLDEYSSTDQYGFIYSIACLHMLVLEEDRKKFYQYLYNHLKEEGYALILTMGDGNRESQSDITKAFDIVKRTHQETNQEMKVATTSCRIVNFDTLEKEATEKHLQIIDKGITEIDNHFEEIMYIILKKNH